MTPSQESSNTKNSEEYIEIRYNKKIKSIPIENKISNFLFNNKLLGLSTVEHCSNFCFGSMNICHLTNNEQLCMINCFNKFSDMVQIGEKIFDGIEEGKFRKTLMINGNFDKFIEDVKKDLFP